MIYKINITKQAKEDLKGIYEYIAFTLFSLKNAEKQLDRLEDQIMSLKEMPKCFRRYESEPWKSKDMRIMPIDHYVVLYTPNDETGVVTINRVMYCGRDIEKQLNELDAN